MHTYAPSRSWVYFDADRPPAVTALVPSCHVYDTPCHTVCFGRDSTNASAGANGLIGSKTNARASIKYSR